MMNDPLRRTGYFFRADDDIDFTPSEYSYFRNEEDIESLVAWFEHVKLAIYWPSWRQKKIIKV